MSQQSGWEAIIGLEIHVQLNTQTKIFSLAPNRFGDEPNTNIDSISTGQPGTLPVLNKAAVAKAVQFGCAVGSKIAKFSQFDRKSYFYPDSPRNFQITQFEHPLIVGGSVSAEVDQEIITFPIEHAHLEDDAGMLKHFSSFAGVDYNRAGVPLIEIVSEPCMHSAKEAVAYAMTIRSIMLYLEASDCNMEEGALRIDANISVRRKGEKQLRNKIEIKNMNSFSNMEIAIDSEIKRQVRLYNENPDTDPDLIIQRGTYRFDIEKGENILMREKEEAADYRYFPEPDLLPLVITDEYIETIRASLPELPHQRFKRYSEELELSTYNASILIADKKLSDFFETGLEHTKNAKSLCNWITVEFVGRLKEKGISLSKSGIESRHIANLVEMIDKGTITGRMAKEIADIMVENPGKDSSTIVEENPQFKPLEDVSEIEPIVDRVIEENPQSIADYKAGRTKALAFLVGQIMKQTKGKASPAIVNKLLITKIEKL